MLCQWGGAQEAGRKQRQDTWPKVAKGVFHTTACHAQYINWGELPGRPRLLLRSVRLGISQWVVSNCIVYHLCLLFSSPFPLLVLYSLLLLFHLIIVVAVVVVVVGGGVVVVYYTLVIGLFLSQPVGFTFFRFCPPSHLEEWGKGGSKQVAAWFWITNWAQTMTTTQPKNRGDPNGTLTYYFETLYPQNSKMSVLFMRSEINVRYQSSKQETRRVGCFHGQLY